jgi:hypothetical protein
VEPHIGAAKVVKGCRGFHGLDGVFEPVEVGSRCPLGSEDGRSNFDVVGRWTGLNTALAGWTAIPHRMNVHSARRPG